MCTKSCCSHINKLWLPEFSKRHSRLKLKKESGGLRHGSIVWLHPDQEDGPILVCWLQHESVQEFRYYRRKERIRSKQQNFGQQYVKNQEIYGGWPGLEVIRGWPGLEVEQAIDAVHPKEVPIAVDLSWWEADIKEDHLNNQSISGHFL